MNYSYSWWYGHRGFHNWVKYMPTSKHNKARQQRFKAKHKR